MTLQELNREYFYLYDDLHHAQKVLPEKQREIMYKALLEQYNRDLRHYLDLQVLDNAEAAFELKFKLKKYIPRRGFLMYNKVAKRLLKRYKADFLNILKSLDVRSIAESDVEETETEGEEKAESTALTEKRNDIANKSG